MANTDKARLDWLERHPYVEATGVNPDSDGRYGLQWWRWAGKPLRDAIDEEMEKDDG